MILKEETFGEVPLLHLVSEENRNKEVPVAVFHHGFMSAKEHNLHFAVNLAKNGIRVILPDAKYHGVRAEGLDDRELRERFWDTVMNSVDELAVIRETLQQRKLLSKEKIGVSGTSMGGIVSCGALASYDWVDAAAVMMGAPGFVKRATEQIEDMKKDGVEFSITEQEKEDILTRLENYDITKHPERLKKRPVHFWHGKLDSIVPFQPAWDFYKSVQLDYEDVPERLSFTVNPAAGHVVPRPAMIEAMGILAGHLNA